jgi:hypothetical protein
MIVVVTGLRLDHQGIGRILKSTEVDRAIGKPADRIEARVRSDVDDDMPVTQTAYTTDRAARAVTIAHPAGVAHQVRHGTLTRAAAAEGLEVRS